MPVTRVPNIHIHITTICRFDFWFGLVLFVLLGVFRGVGVCFFFFFLFSFWKQLKQFFLFELPTLCKLYCSCKRTGWQHCPVSKQSQKVEVKSWNNLFCSRSDNLTFSYLQNDLWLWKTYPIFFRLIWIQRNKKNVLRQRKEAFCHFGKRVIIQYPLFCSKQTWQTQLEYQIGNWLQQELANIFILFYLFKNSLRALLGPRTCKANVVLKDRHSSQDSLCSYKGMISKCLALLVHGTHQHFHCQYVNSGFGKEPSRKIY